MGMMANIVCKTVGIAGMSAVLYDAYSLGSKNSKRNMQKVNANHFEKVIADTRTLSSESAVSGAMQKKVADFRMNNPLISIFGTVSGFVSGALNSLGDNIIPAACASIALAAKGTLAKVGAWGTAGYGIYTVLKEGFGATKKSPMDE